MTQDRDRRQMELYLLKSHVSNTVNYRESWFECAPPEVEMMAQSDVLVG